MEPKALEDAYWQTLATITNIKDIRNVPPFIFMDSDAWIWGVRMYGIFLRDFCSTVNRSTLRQYIARTNRLQSKHDQAKHILKLLGISDEPEEGWWLKQFRRELDNVSGKSGYPDKRSFTVPERPRFLTGVRTLAQRVEFTSITLGLALIETVRIRSSEEKRVNKLLEVLPAKAEEFFLPKPHILLKP